MRRPRVLIDRCRLGRIRVDGSAAQHILRVLRLGRGAEIVFFDGTGLEAPAVIRETGAGWFEAEATEDIVRRSMGGGRLVMAVATPKGERADWLVEKCAELGASRVTFIETARGVVEPGPNKLERWRRKAREAARQSRSPALMDVDAGLSLSAWIASISASSLVLFGDVSSGSPAMGDALRKIAGGPRDIYMAIGPEGGFTVDEVASLGTVDGMGVSLGATVLRVETAAVAAAAVWADWHRRGDGEAADDGYTLDA